MLFVLPLNHAECSKHLCSACDSACGSNCYSLRKHQGRPHEQDVADLDDFVWVLIGHQPAGDLGSGL